MGLMKDFLSEPDNMDKLCNSTEPDATLLKLLLNRKVITGEIEDKINGANGKLSKNTILYTFLRDSRSDEDLDHIISALETNGSSKAKAYFENLRTNKLQTGSSSGTTPSLAATSSVKQTTMSISKIANLIKDDPKILEDITTLHKTFGVGEAVVFSALKMYRMDQTPANEILRKIFTKWRASRYERNAKGSHFLEILESAECFTAAEILSGAGLGADTSIEY